MFYFSNLNSEYHYNHKNLIRIYQRIDDLITDYSKLMVIRLDFGLKKEYEHLNTHQYMATAFDRLRNEFRYNTLFKHNITYIAKLGYGSEKRFHYHILFFFVCIKINRDILLSK